MDNNYIKNRAKELLILIKEAEEELNNIRKMCKHSNYIVKDTNFGVGASKLRKVCESCEEVIGIPSENDLKNNGYK